MFDGDGVVGAARGEAREGRARRVRAGQHRRDDREDGRVGTDRAVAVRQVPRRSGRVGRAWHLRAVGPKINGNPEGVVGRHQLVRHAAAAKLVGAIAAPRDYDGLRDYLAVHPYEGIVWHHPDGRMAKLKARDFA
jgi:hypothetical protein